MKAPLAVARTHSTHTASDSPRTTAAAAAGAMTMRGMQNPMLPTGRAWALVLALAAPWLPAAASIAANEPAPCRLRGIEHEALCGSAVNFGEGRNGIPNVSMGKISFPG